MKTDSQLLNEAYENIQRRKEPIKAEAKAVVTRRPDKMFETILNEIMKSGLEYALSRYYSPEQTIEILRRNNPKLARAAVQYLKSINEIHKAFEPYLNRRDDGYGGKWGDESYND